MARESLTSKLMKELEEIEIVFASTCPFLAALFPKLGIKYDEKYPGIACTDGRYITLSPDWLALTGLAKLFVIAHEVIHAAFHHPLRMPPDHKHLWNIAADYLVNNILLALKYDPGELSNDIIFSIPPHFHKGDLNHTVEEVFLRLLREDRHFMPFLPQRIRDLVKKTTGKVVRPPGGGMRRGKICEESGQGSKIRANGSKGGNMKERQPGGSDSEKENREEGSEATRDQRVRKLEKEGSCEGHQGNKRENRSGQRAREREALEDQVEDVFEDDEDVEDYPAITLEDLYQAYETAKLAGTLPAGLKRLFERILQPAVNWKAILKLFFKRAFDSYRVYTWRKEHRKVPDLLPGYTRLGRPRVVVLVDTSGSISEGELSQFVSEVYAIARLRARELYVIPWDATAYEVQRMRSPSDVRFRLRLWGGGGTIIRQALEKADELTRPRDIVVVLSDGYIYDKESEETLELARKLAKKCFTVACYTGEPFFQEAGWKSVEVSFFA